MNQAWALLRKEISLVLTDWRLNSIPVQLYKRDCWLPFLQSINHFRKPFKRVMLPDTPYFHDDWPLFLVCQSSPHILNRASLLTQRSNENHAHSIGSLIFRQPWPKQPLLYKRVENELKRQIFVPTKNILLSYRFLLRVINKWYGFKLFWLFWFGLVIGCYYETALFWGQKALCLVAL